ncbi:SDR family oxidoreductase [Candidatus Pantoea multigeneris]|uniref:SDR family oxidoreductase n=1 Tax=Candidatus Pantoea multigeneris TaxID=2608357 RepID=A0ABX0RAA6_9GAMM|nr:SDR family oxidoreductase [Pantoea multigeneris]NIF21272.1 SDR family oxidoreductase [Pantoea multigeneris]
MSKKMALITGASRGIGAAVARHFWAQGYSLLLVARDAQRLERFAASLHEQLGQQVTLLAVDLSDPVATAEVLTPVLSQLHKIDVLVNAAGIFRPGSSKALLPDFSAMLDVNVTAVHHLCQLALPALRHAGRAHIFNLSSLSGVQAYGSIAGYAASKHALVGYSLSLSRELAGQGIKVSVLCPDVVDTDMSVGSGLTAEEMLQPEDICKSIAFILSLSPAAHIEKLVLGRVYRPAVKK